MLQNVLHKLYKWADTNNMKFNANKFELLLYGKEQEIKSATTYQLYDDSNIDDKEQARDLGIMMSNTASFTPHIKNIVKKARDKMGWVMRVFQSRKRSLMLTLLKSLVIPLLEYYCHPLESMESKRNTSYRGIQRTFTYKITEVQHLNYWERLHEPKLFSLQRRRERYIITYIYLEDNTSYGTKFLWDNGAQNKNQKTPRTWNTVRYSVSNKQKPSTIPSKKCNNCIWASVAQLVAKISERHRKC